MFHRTIEEQKRNETLGNPCTSRVSISVRQCVLPWRDVILFWRMTGFGMEASQWVLPYIYRIENGCSGKNVRAWRKSGTRCSSTWFKFLKFRMIQRRPDKNSRGRRNNDDSCYRTEHGVLLVSLWPGSFRCFLMSAVFRLFWFPIWRKSSLESLKQQNKRIERTKVSYQ